MFGGIYTDHSKDSPTKFLQVFRYDIDKKNWQELPSLPEATLEASPLVPLRIPGKILFMSFSKSVWQLDLKTMEYSKVTPMPEEVFVDRFAWLNNRIIGAGGGEQDRITSPSVGMDVYRKAKPRLA